MGSFFRGARSRYKQHLEDVKKEKEASATSRKRKNILEEMKEQKLKRAKLEKRMEILENEADTLSLEAGKKENIQALSKANALSK